MGRDNNFNLIRLVLAMTVIFTHSYVFVFGLGQTDVFGRATGNKLELADMAVNCFFTISGFLIAQSWLSDPNMPRYLWKRVRRIYPAFLVSGLFCGFVLHPWIVGWGDFYSKVDLKRLVLGLGLLQYWAPRTILPQHGIAMNFSGASWTILPEFECYVLLMALGLSGLLKRRGVVLGLFGGVIVLYCLQAAGILSLKGLRNIYLLPLPDETIRLTMFFLAGCSALLWWDKFEAKPAIAAVAAVVVAGSFFIPAYAEPLMAVVGTYLLLFVAQMKVPALDWFKKAGDISYGTYLYGFPLQFSLAMRFPGLGFWTHFFIGLGLALAFGWLSWNLVEKWALGKRRG